MILCAVAVLLLAAGPLRGQEYGRIDFTNAVIRIWRENRVAHFQITHQTRARDSTGAWVYTPNPERVWRTSARALDGSIIRNLADRMMQPPLPFGLKYPLAWPIVGDSIKFEITCDWTVTPHLCWANLGHRRLFGMSTIRITPSIPASAVRTIVYAVIAARDSASGPPLRLDFRQP